MKQFRGSILLLLFIFSSFFVRAQTTTLYTGGATGSFEDPSDFSNGAPNANTNVEVITDFVEQSGNNGTENGLDTITLTESTSDQAAALFIAAPFTSINNGAETPEAGTITLIQNNNSTLTIGQNFQGGFDGLELDGLITFNLTGGGTVVIDNGDIILGTTDEINGSSFSPTATFNLVSGALNFNNGTGSTLSLGFDVGGTGVFNQTGTSTVTGENLEIGENGTGTYSLAGTGSVTISGSTVIGDQSGSQGTLNQSGGTFNETGGSLFEVGGGGTGVYNLSGGSGNFDNIAVGGGASGSGTINQSAGTINAAGTVTIGDAGTGTYNLSGGMANLSGDLIVGGSSTGTVNQTGGALTVTGMTTVGDAGTGIYNISGNGMATFTDGLIVGDAASLGTFNQNGGTVILPTGAGVDLSRAGNSYNLNGGTLEIGATGLTGVAGEGTFNFGGGTLDAMASLTDALDGTLSGNSHITSPGTVILSGTLTGGGSLTLNGGTLQASSANLPQISSVALAPGTTFNLTTSGNALDVFSGSISGGGSLETGNSGVSDSGTTITAPAGYRLIVHTIILPTGTTTIANDTGLEAATGTINGLTGGAGTTFEVGGGAGTITLLGTATVPMITVESGSGLAAGNVVGDITTNGTVMTLSPESTLNVTGDFTQPMEASVAQEGTLAIRTNGTTSDVLSATTATLYGTIKVTGVGSNSYEIVRTAAPGALTTGTLNSATPGGLATSPNLPLFTSTLSYVLQSGPNNAEGLELTTVQSNLTPFALTNNQRAVAGAIDTVIQNPPSSFVPLLLAINTLSGSDVPNLLDQLSPRGYLYMRDIAFENSTFLAQKVDGFLAHLRDGYSGLDTSGLSILSPGLDSGLGRSLGSLLAYNNEGLAPNGVNYYPEDPDAPIAPNSGPGESTASPGTISDSEDPRLAPTVAPPPSTSIFDGKGTGFNEFVSGDVILANLNQNASGNNEPQAHYTAGNATAGISFRMSSNLAAGVLFDYNHTDAQTDVQGSHIRVDSYSPGLFATFFERGFYANGLFTFGYNTYSDNRNLAFGGTGATATSSPDGQQYVGDLDFGYDFHPNQHWAVGPTLGIEYTHLDVDSFHETGADVADLTVNSQSADSLRGRIGAHAVYLARAGQILFQPNLTVAFQREFLNDDFNLTSQLDIPGTPAFSIQGSNPGRNSALIGLGLTATLDNDMSLYLDYLAEVGGDDYFVQSVEGGLKASF
jgi:uncharacterized protein YhjY with autotransporter beta-barrel domain